MDFSFGAARDLYKQHKHPRIFFGPDDVPTLRRRITKGAGLKIMKRLRAKTAPIVDVVLNNDDLPAMIAAWNTDWRQDGTHVVFGMVEVAAVALLDRDQQALEAVRRVLTCTPQAQRLSRPGVRRLGYAVEYNFVYAYDMIADQIPARDRRVFTKWALNEGIRSVMKSVEGRYRKSAGGNMTLQAMLSAFSTWMTIAGDPGVPNLLKEKELLLSYVDATLRAAIGPDGYPEEDIGYGSACGGMLAYIVEPLRRAGIYDVYRECPRYARFSNAMLHFVQPWGENLSNTGDHGDGFGWRELVLPRHAAETKNPVLLWLLETLNYEDNHSHWNDPSARWRKGETPLGKGRQVPSRAVSLLFTQDYKKEQHPAKANVSTAFRDRTRGIVSFRSGWDKDDTFVVFDGSQRSCSGQGHAHASCGHFSLSALGEYFSIDTGRYNNEQNCHSVVIVNGKSGRSLDGEWRAVSHAGTLTGYEPGGFVDFASVNSSLQHDCYWAKRYIGLVKGSGMPAYSWIVDDLNKDNCWAEYWWQLQTSPENTIKTYKDHATITGCRHGNKLDIHFALPAPDEYPNSHRIIAIKQDTVTPSAFKYITNPHVRAKEWGRPSNMVHGPAYVRPRLVTKVAGWNGRFMSLLLPRKSTSKPASVKRLRSLPASLAMEVVSGNVRDTIIFAHEHNLLEAGGIVGRGHWCVVRRDKRSGKIVDYTIREGTSLSVDGKKLV